MHTVTDIQRRHKHDLLRLQVARDMKPQNHSQHSCFSYKVNTSTVHSNKTSFQALFKL